MAHTPHFSIVDAYIRPNGICLRGIVTDATRASERGAFNGNWCYSCCRSWRELVRFRIECHAEQPIGSMPLHTRIY